MSKICEFFKKEPINKGRQVEVDFFKAISILFMVVCHSVMYLTVDTESGWYFFANMFLGSVLGAGPFFMMSMGLGIIYSRRNDPKSLFKRGLTLFLLSYVFNFFRVGIALLAVYPEGFVDIVFQGDILQFAGLSFMAVALFKKLKLKSYVVLIIAVLLSSISFLFYGLDTGDALLDSFINLFVPTTEDYCAFSFSSWFIFVIAGMLLGNVIQRVQNLDKFYIKTMIGSIVVAVPLIIWYFDILNNDLQFYGMVFPFALGHIASSMFLLGICHFVVKVLPTKVLDISKTASTNITIIYVMHWLVIGNLYISLDSELKPVIWVNYLIGIVLFVATLLLSILYRKVKETFKNQIIKQNG